jgi:predicted aconitase with swiveling domain
MSPVFYGEAVLGQAVFIHYGRGSCSSDRVLPKERGNK